MFLAGRWFTGMSAWGFLILTPVYTAELSPPDLRGFYTGLNGVHIGLGYFLAAAMGRAWLDASAPEAVWRGPLGLYLFFSLLMIVIMLFSPESPRWLLLNGKTEEAEKIIYRMHTVKGNTDFAERELNEMKKQIAIDVTLESSWVRTTTAFLKWHSQCCNADFDVQEAIVPQTHADLHVLLLHWPIYRSFGHQQLRSNILQRAGVWHDRAD